MAAVDDVEPDRLHERIDARLTTRRGARRPTLVTRAYQCVTADLSHGVADSARRVQRIYDGLSLLVNWPTTTPGSTATAKRPTWIFSSRTSRLAWLQLARRTEAADAAVSDSSVRSQTEISFLRPTLIAIDTALETDILELAVVAGVTAAGIRPTPTLREYATELATDGLPPNAELLGEEVADALRARAGAEQPSGDGPRPPPTTDVTRRR